MRGKTEIFRRVFGNWREKIWVGLEMQIQFRKDFSFISY